MTAAATPGSQRFAPAGALRGALRPPADKSISHRAAILAAMADGRSSVGGYLDAGDTRSTLAAVSALGAEVEVERTASGVGPALELRIRGAGLRGARPAALDVGNAGTLLRILPGWLAGQGGGEWTLDGDASIRRRPVDRVVEPLRRMGADAECRDGRLPPLRVRGAELRGARHDLAVASAQVKSCLLLAGLLADGPTEVREPAPSRDHTERMLAAAGARVGSERLGTLPVVRGAAPVLVSVEPAERLEPVGFRVPGDFSSAAFWMVAALLVAGSDVRLEGVGLNPTRIGLLGILTRMGAAVDVVEEPALDGEPRGTLRARHGPLSATRVGAAEVPVTIDELPLVALAACFAEGETVVSGAGELRHKESDRIAGVVEGLAGVGADIEARDDGFACRGSGGLRGGSIDARGDHRLAMLGAIAGLASREGVEVRGYEAAAISYPRFGDDLRALVGR